MSIRKALTALFDSTPKDDPAVKHPKFTDVSLWILLGFGAMLIWLAHGIVTEANVQRLFIGAIVFMIGDTVKAVTVMIVNGATKRTLAKQFMRDGKLDDNESNALSETSSMTLGKTPTASP